MGDPVDLYYTVRYEGLEVLGEEVHEELPEDEALRRCRKLVRDYRREVGRAAAAAASPAAKATSRGSARSAASGRARGSAGGRAHARPWTDEEVAQVQKLGREQRGKQLGEAGFAELVGRLASGDSGGLYIGTTGVACIGAHKAIKKCFFNRPIALSHSHTTKKNKTCFIDQ
eukprot:COSAG01_NODE_351_length_18449_cov_34.646886_8_plen_172_part_00